MKNQPLLQTVKIMKWSIYGFFLQTVMVQLLCASEVKSQRSVSAREVYVTVSFENSSVKDVIEKIEELTDYQFSYDESDLKNCRNFNLKKQKLSLADLLSKVSERASLQFMRVNKVINVSKVETADKTELVRPVPAQTVTGKVNASDLEGGLPGVNITIKGTSQGTVTDANGDYKVTVPTPESILVFSSIGYKTTEIVVGERAVIDITLDPDITSLGEIIVVGYGSQKKDNLTGAVASIKSQELTNAPVANTTNALAGRLPGLISLQTSGQPGDDAARLSIRGFGDALVIVDGIQTDFKFLDPNQIESITILKDASASIYGARAGNGVILVTTKRGSDGKPKFTFNTSKTLQGITIMPKPVNAAQFAELSRESWINSGQPEATAPYTLDDIQKYRSGEKPSTNWYDELIRDWAPQQQHNISVRGGNEMIKYYGFLGYLDQETVFKTGGGDYKRYNFQSNIDAKILDNLNLELTIASIIEDRNFPHVSLSSGEASAWGYFWNTLPTYPAHLPDPTKVPYADGNGTGGAHVISNSAISGYNNNDRQDLRGALALNYDFKFVPGLSARVFTNYQASYSNNKTFIKPVPLYTYEPTSETYSLWGTFRADNPLTLRSDKSRILTGQFSLSYDKMIGSDHHVSALALYEVIDYSSDYVSATRMNFITPTLDQLYAGSTSTQSNDGRATINSRTSFVNRLNYSYRNKYLLETILRADATPVFPENTRWGYFPSVSVGWRMSEENFLANSGIVDNLKLRLSYGQAGVDYSSANIYRYLSGYSITGQTYILGNVNGKGVESIGMPNPNITWEKIITYNAGVDFTLLNQKIYGEADVFYRERNNILGSRNRSLPSTFGATLPLENINSSNDRGFELKVGTTGTYNDLQWDVSGNISWSRAKWAHYDEPVYTDPDNIRIDKHSGQWMDRQIGYVTDGLFTSQEEINAATVIQDNNNNTTLKPGDVRVVDTSGDGKIDWRDQVEIGKGTIPHWMAGLNLSLKYKHFDFAALFQGAFGYNTYIAFSQGKVYPTFVYEERWTEENNDRDALVPRIGSSGGGYNLATTSMRYKNAGYVRLKSLTLGYNIPKQLLEKVKLDQVRIYIAGTNLLTFDKLKKFNIDPETPSFDSSGSLSAHSGRYYPQQRTISIGASISF